MTRWCLLLPVSCKSGVFPASPWGHPGPSRGLALGLLNHQKTHLSSHEVVKPLVRSSNPAEPALSLLHREPCSKSEVTGC